MRMFKMLTVVAMLFMYIATTHAQGVAESPAIEGKKPNKPDRHDRHKPDDVDVPTPAPDPQPVPIPPRPPVNPEPDHHFHVAPTPHPQPEHHVQPIRPDHGLRPAIHWIDNLRGWITPSHYLPSLYDLLLFAGLIIGGILLFKRK
ncbi:MAG: hypothetical protein JWM11_6512 [Planctomycetaceae bacterium]|nr:hypothetical protein [Planctomycetaceae bacterium]